MSDVLICSKVAGSAARKENRGKERSEQPKQRYALTKIEV